MATLTKDLIYKVLSKQSNPMHVDDIAQKIIDSGIMLGMSKGKLAKKISSRLSLDIRKKKDTMFRKISNGKKGHKRGFYGIKKKKITAEEKSIKRMGEKVEGREKTNSLFTGKAGEYAVLSELLFREYNASVMTVDQGVDIVAIKNEQLFKIQVKTANYSKGGYLACVDIKQFKRHNNKDTFYVFVLRFMGEGSLRSNFIVFSSMYIQQLIDKGVINDSNKLSIKFSIRNGKIYLNNIENVSACLNKFEYIK